MKSLLKSTFLYNLTAILVVIFIYYFTTNSSSQEDFRQAKQALNQGQQTCQLDKVVDGDSIYVNCANQRYSIRIADIDAPELAQSPWGEAAKDYLHQQLPTKLQLQIGEKDRYQRYLATVFVDGKDVALDLLANGYAVVYSQYSPPQNYREAMKTAKREKVGVWKEDGLQQNPQLYRRLAF